MTSVSQRDEIHLLKAVAESGQKNNMNEIKLTLQWRLFPMPIELYRTLSRLPRQWKPSSCLKTNYINIQILLLKWCNKQAGRIHLLFVEDNINSVLFYNYFNSQLNEITGLCKEVKHCSIRVKSFIQS